MQGYDNLITLRYIYIYLSCCEKSIRFVMTLYQALLMALVSLPFCVLEG